ncbi:MAG: HIT domain-containing protein [Candidatus Paceibacterota bacterium]
MKDCIFCKIISHELPAHRVYEDDDFLAFLDIDPVSAGHTLIIPKEHHRWVWDVKNIGAYFKVVQKIAYAMKKAFTVELVESKVVGEEVHHAHVWLFPNPQESTGDKNDFVGNMEKIKVALA